MGAVSESLRKTDKLTQIGHSSAVNKTNSPKVLLSSTVAKSWGQGQHIWERRVGSHVSKSNLTTLRESVFLDTTGLLFNNCNPHLPSFLFLSNIFIMCTQRKITSWFNTAVLLCLCWGILGQCSLAAFPHTLHHNSPNTQHQDTNCYVAAGPCFINGLDQNSRSPQLPADSGETAFHSLGQDVVCIDITFSSRFSPHRTADHGHFSSSLKSPF